MKRTNYDGMTRAEKIEYYAHINNTICISNNNSKTGGGIYTLSFPVGISCRNNAPCLKGCYATKGKQAIPNVAGAYYRNYRIYNENPAEFWRQVNAYIALYDIHILRLFDSGDIPDADFLTGLRTLAKEHPEMIIYGYTKKFELINLDISINGKFPENLVMWLSTWDKSFTIENPHDLPVTYIKFHDPEKTRCDIPANAFHCVGRSATCTLCRACFNKKHTAVLFDEH